MSSTRRGPFVRALGVAAALAVAVTGLVTADSSSAVSAANGTGTGTGYLSTRGNQIIDSTGATVRLTGLNWFGMETDNHTFHGLWATVTWKSMMDQMAKLGYNTIRVPFAGDSLASGAQATSVNSYVNPDLVGLSPIQILDKVVDYAGRLGMRIILDRHRPSTAGQTALWYTPTVSEASEVADWKMLRPATRATRQSPAPTSSTSRTPRAPTPTAPARAGAAATPHVTGGSQRSASGTPSSRPTHAG